MIFRSPPGSKRTTRPVGLFATSPPRLSKTDAHSFPQESDTCSITRCVDQMFAEAQMTQDEHINYHKPATRPSLAARRRSVANRAPRTRQFERGAEPHRSMCQITCTATTYQVSVRQGRVCAARRASERKGSHAKSFSPAQSRALLAA